MGVIQRQAIKGSIFSYIGVLLGFVNAIILAPRILTSEQIGLTSILIAYSLPFIQFSALGFISVINRLFPYFRDEKSKHNGFLAVTLFVTMGGFLLAILVYFLLRPVFIKDNIEQSPLFVDYLDYLIPLIFFSLLFMILDAYNRVLYDAVLGTFLKDFFSKIVYLTVLLLYLFGIITFSQFVFSFILVQCLPGIIITIILIYRGHFSLRLPRGFISRRMVRIMVNLCLFGILAGLSGIAISTVDRLMINSMIDLSATGIYTVAFYFSVILLIPIKSVRNISTPFIAELMKKKDFRSMKSIYYKSSLNQLIIGLLLFVGIWANIHNVFSILPEEYEAGKYVIFFMMLAKLFELATGVANLIIGTSRYYRVSTYLVFFLLVIVIISNLLFIPVYGIIGASIASAICAFLFNLARYLFVCWKFDMQIFNHKFLILLFISLASYFGSLLMPVFANFIIDILIRSIAITLVFGVFILVFNVSQEVTNEVRSVLRRIKINI